MMRRLEGGGRSLSPLGVRKMNAFEAKFSKKQFWNKWRYQGVAVRVKDDGGKTKVRCERWFSNKDDAVEDAKAMIQEIKW